MLLCVVASMCIASFFHSIPFSACPFATIALVSIHSCDYSCCCIGGSIHEQDTAQWSTGALLQAFDFEEPSHPPSPVPTDPQSTPPQRNARPQLQLNEQQQLDSLVSPALLDDSPDSSGATSTSRQPLARKHTYHAQQQQQQQQQLDTLAAPVLLGTSPQKQLDSLPLLALPDSSPLCQHTAASPSAQLASKVAQLAQHVASEQSAVQTDSLQPLQYSPGARQVFGADQPSATAGAASDAAVHSQLPDFAKRFSSAQASAAKHSDELHTTSRNPSAPAASMAASKSLQQGLSSQSTQRTSTCPGPALPNDASLLSDELLSDDEQIDDDSLMSEAAHSLSLVQGIGPMDPHGQMPDGDFGATQSTNVLSHALLPDQATMATQPEAFLAYLQTNEQLSPVSSCSAATDLSQADEDDLFMHPIQQLQHQSAADMLLAHTASPQRVHKQQQHHSLSGVLPSCKASPQYLPKQHPAQHRLGTVTSACLDTWDESSSSSQTISPMQYTTQISQPSDKTEQGSSMESADQPMHSPSVPQARSLPDAKGNSALATGQSHSPGAGAEFGIPAFPRAKSPQDDSAALTVAAGLDSVAANGHSTFAAMLGLAKIVTSRQPVSRRPSGAPLATAAGHSPQSDGGMAAIEVGPQ